MTVEDMVRSAIGSAPTLNIEPLEGGIHNASHKVTMARGVFVVRVFHRYPKACQKEVALYKLIANSVPVAELVYASPHSSPPFSVYRYVEGITFLELKRSGDVAALQEAAHSVGEALGAIGRIDFFGGASLQPHLQSEVLRTRLPADLLQNVVSVIADLRDFNTTTKLVHGDFSRRNVIVHRRNGHWSVAGILDWELAGSGSPLTDIGSFLRYDSGVQEDLGQSYVNSGGTLPYDWRRQASFYDLKSLCHTLTKPELPDDFVREIVEIIRSTFPDAAAPPTTHVPWQSQTSS